MKNFKIIIRNIFLRERTKTLYRKLSKLKSIMMLPLNDEQFTKINIRMNSGIKLELKKPERFIDKINWLKLNYRNPLQTEYTDKYLMRNHLINHGYNHLLPPLIGVFESFDDIDFNQMPEKVFLKTNHTSGVNQLVEKGKTDLHKVKSRFNRALKDNYYKYSREWNYKNIHPKILVEEYLSDDKLVDYKFFVFGGKVEFFGVIKNIIDKEGRASLNSQINLYEKTLKKSDIDINRTGFDDSDFELSQYVTEMIEVAETLASPFPFCRVDFLVGQNKLYFGEMTFHPNGGQLVLNPIDNEIKYGQKIDLTRIPRNHLKPDN
ncbi:ATP-grasp fold amidoligase family protein [Staphylococcus sp. MI 10-1553]|uniref:ATP-grasp fold amidoligase family protein n=1 Tax=Staphylococcus sp. MI 10-1553 TaxID=1912064 RepID=UPI001EF06361|nr:ATP-grasp fold amidoligase family protein [Staphylococcus sp. MI 10-1553]